MIIGSKRSIKPARGRSWVFFYITATAATAARGSDDDGDVPTPPENAFLPLGAFDFIAAFIAVNSFIGAGVVDAAVCGLVFWYISPEWSRRHYSSP